MTVANASTRLIVRLMRRGDLGGRTSQRAYRDFDSGALWAHVVDHVFNPAESWADRLGPTLPAKGRPPKKIRRAAALLRVGITLRGIQEDLKAKYDLAAPLVFDYLLSYPEFGALNALVARHPSRLDEAFRAANSAWRFAGGDSAAAMALLRPELKAVLGRSYATAALDALQAAQRRELFGPLLEALSARSELLRILEERPLRPKLFRQIDDIRGKTLRIPRMGSFLSSLYKAQEESLGRIDGWIGANGPLVAAAYLDAGFAAARSAGIKPRHCVYRRPYLPRGEGFVDDAGVAVCIGRARDLSYHLLTIHVPTAGRSAVEKSNIAINQQTLRAAASPMTSAEVERFLDEFRVGDVVERLYSVPNWRGR